MISLNTFNAIVFWIAVALAVSIPQRRVVAFFQTIKRHSIREIDSLDALIGTNIRVRDYVSIYSNAALQLRFWIILAAIYSADMQSPLWIAIFLFLPVVSGSITYKT